MIDSGPSVSFWHRPIFYGSKQTPQTFMCHILLQQCVAKLMVLWCMCQGPVHQQQSLLYTKRHDRLASKHVSLLVLL